MKTKRFVKSAFSPDEKVSLVLIDGRVIPSVKKDLIRMNIKWISVEPISDLYSAISAHPDIQCHPLGGDKIIVAPNVSESLKNQLIQHDFEILIGNTILGSNYPMNIAYNVARIGKFAFHNTQFTDPVLRTELEKQGVLLIHINQGYSKCSILAVDERSVITSDKGIAKVLERNEFDVLCIEPGSISLPGLNYGFIGGTAGLISPDTLAFIGYLEHHPQMKTIERFIEAKGKTIVALGNIQLMDMGSLIPIKEWCNE